MAAISGHKASIKLANATDTTSTNEAAVLSTDGVTLQITAATKRYWDKDDAPTWPKVYAPASTSSAVSSTTYTVNYVQGIVTFTTPHTTVGTYTLDVHYVTPSSWGNARQWSLNIESPILDDSVFGSTWKTGVAAMRSAGASVGGFWTLAGNSTAPLPFDFLDGEVKVLAALYPGTTQADRYEGFAWLNTNQIQAQADALVGETVDLVFEGPVYFTTST